MAKVTDESLKPIVDAEISAAIGYFSSELAEERSTSMDRYLGEPLGTEMEGRSRVQTRDVMDVIEWILPSLIRIFTDSNSAVTFEPVGPEDEQQAEQETDYINYLFYKKNNGFLLLYTWFKDALLQKNGIIKSYPEMEKETTRETYTNLTDEEFNYLNSDKANELIEHETHGIPDYDGLGANILHDATFLRTEDKTSIKICNVAPEEFLISSDIRTIDPKEARFTAQRTYLTVSDLKEMGYSQKDIDQMENGPDVSLAKESQSRKNLSDEIMENDDVNEAMRTKKVYECYLKADRNGDGIAETLKIIRSGDFIEIEEVDNSPFVALTPIILTHKFYGLSVADIVKDIQEIKTMLLRSYMDNVYQSINGTTYYDLNRVNVDDMLTSVPYGIRGVDGTPGDSILHIPPAGLPPQVFDLFELMDGIKQQRVGDFQAQIDPSVLANANTGVIMRMTMEAKAKTEMIARIFAETGVKELFRDLHALSRKYSDKECVVKLRNSWVPVNPSGWRERYDLTVKVGLGNATKEEKVSTMMDIIAIQERIAASGGVGTVLSPENIYESSTEYIKALGKANPDKYITNPANIPPSPPQPDPQMALIQAQMEIEKLKYMASKEKLMVENQQSQRQEAIKMRELDVNAQKIAAQNQIDAIKFNVNSGTEQAKIANESTKLELQRQAMITDENLKKIEMILDQGKAHEERAIEKYIADQKAALELINSTIKATQEETKIQASAFAKAEAYMLDMMEKMNGLLVEMNAPKKIERDVNGKIVMIGNKKVMRDAVGRLEGIG